MHDPILTSQITGAEAYEQLMVPALFAEWAPRVARAAEIAVGHIVLDVASGTGVLAREAARYVGDRGRVIGIDPNPGMLAVARRLSPEVDWRQASAESIPSPDDSFDAVVSQFGLMFFGDQQGALREFVRVLKPGGHYAVAVWDSLYANAAYDIESAIVEDIAGKRAADPIRAPFALGDKDGLESLFLKAGLTDCAITTLSGTGRFPSVEAMTDADLRGWLPVVGVLLSEEEIAAIRFEVERQLAEYVQPDGSVVFPTSAHIVYGRGS